MDGTPLHKDTHTYRGTCAHTLFHTHTHTDTYTHRHTDTHTHTYTHTHTHTHTNTHTHTHTHTHTPSPFDYRSLLKGKKMSLSNSPGFHNFLKIKTEQELTCLFGKPL